MDVSSALALYDANVAHLQQQGAELRASIEAALVDLPVKLHSVTMRVKSREAVQQKLARPDRTYDDLWQITDLVGLRITTYFEDSIDVVAQAIERQLQVDFTHSVDKRRTQDSQAFGYRSLHYVCAFGENRPASFPEHARCEIQIRTLLQHAWAEIEHDLGYKTVEAVPVSVRRRFSRIASLLEIADQEFMAVRQELQAYVSKLPVRLASGGDVALDSLSLPALLAREDVHELDRAIAERLGRPLNDAPFFPYYLVRMLHLCGINTVSDALERLASQRERVLSLVKPYFTFADEEWKLSPAQMPSLFRGYSLFFLAHVALLDSPLLGISKTERLARFYGELDYPDDPRSAQRVAAGLLAAFGQAV